MKLQILFSFDTQCVCMFDLINEDAFTEHSSYVFHSVLATLGFVLTSAFDSLSRVRHCNHRPPHSNCDVYSWKTNHEGARMKCAMKTRTVQPSFRLGQKQGQTALPSENASEGMTGIMASCQQTSHTSYSSHCEQAKLYQNLKPEPFGRKNECRPFDNTNLRSA
jgi:hypothetical protein